MTVVGLFVMLAIAAYLARSLRGTALWPLALPIALAFGEAGFVQTWDLEMRIPYFPVPIRWPHLVFGVLCVAWLMVSRLSPPEGRSSVPMGADAAPIIAWMVMAALAVMLGWVDEGRIRPWFVWDVSFYCFLPLSFAMLYDIFRKTRREDVWRLFQSLSVVVSVLAVIYALHIAGLSLYDLAGVKSYYWETSAVRRDSLTFPVWACFTIPFLLWQGRIGAAKSIMLLAQLGAVAMSLTRSLVLACVLSVLLVVVMRFLDGRRADQLFLPAGLAAVAVGAFTWAAPRTFKRAAAMLFERFDELSRGVGSVPTMVSRLTVAERVSSFLKGWTLLTGAGFSIAAQEEVERTFRSILVADSLWSLVLLTFGIIGVTLMAGTLLLGIVRGARAAWDQRGDPLALAVIGTAAVLWLAARTPASSEIISFYPIVCGFALALVVAEARRAWSQSASVRALALDGGEIDALVARLPKGRGFRIVLAVAALGLEVMIGRMVSG